ncbi:VDAC2-like protein [Mya arenaria]|uniref:VDAC2-like protein n=1 Tax=Mya arenaria TaxID=6604 RepID=A0ABY7DJZ3_MYAAR|nr:voltage-dependent anion-selective channel protein 2-like [Mya arenaria]XP_052788489.1 voltage-dependent anion-selective channel protein 2-like [Mya arenaria]WAQ96979.1 VDAC2-like protein [Mya arenaria]WAQ97022.1 VDAC2-like protein [Mya arenaria]
MAPPTYADLGKSARDLFSKGFNFGFHKLEVTTKTDSGVKFTTKGSHSKETDRISGELNTEYKYNEYGLTFKETWTTENKLSTEVTIEDQLAKGFKLTFDTAFEPQTSKKSGQVKTGYKNDYVNFTGDCDFNFAGPTINGALVLGYNNWLAGYQMAFDTSKSKLTKNNFGLGYTAGDLAINANVNDLQEFQSSIHNRVNSDLDLGIQMSWTQGTNATSLGLAAKYALDRNSAINAKVNNKGQLGLGYSQNIRPGVKLTLSTLLDGLNAGGRKIGVGLEFNN